MPALANKAYFNYGGQGPLPSPSLDAINNSWSKIQELGPFTNNVWPYVASELDTTREHLAKICGVKAKRLALTENVTSGCVLPLWGLPFSSGDHLLISDCEHPGVVSACIELARRKHLSIDILPVEQLRDGVTQKEDTEQKLLKILDVGLKPNTKLVVISHLLWNTGQIMPISAIAQQLTNHPNKPFLLVDAAQSFGQISVNETASKADIFAFTGHKWACGPEGLGAVAISERVLTESTPTLIGWRALQNEGKVSDKDSEPFHLDSRRFEIATSCTPLLAGLRCSLELLEKEVPESKRGTKIQELSSHLWKKLDGIKGVETILNGAPPAGLVSFSLPQRKSTKEIVRLLGKQNLWIRDLESPICLRACLHITTRTKEIDYLSTAIKELANVTN